MPHSLHPESTMSVSPQQQQPTIVASNSWWRSLKGRARSASTSSQGLPTSGSFQDASYSPTTLSMSSSPGSASAIDNNNNNNIARSTETSKVSNDNNTNPTPIESSTKSHIPHSYSTPSSLVVPDTSKQLNDRSNASTIPPTITSSSSMLLSPHTLQQQQRSPPQSPTRQQIFGLPLDESIAAASVRVTLADANGSQYTFGRIPIVVAKCCMFLKESATQVHGIFRLSGSTKRIRELEAIFETPPQFGKNLEWTGFNVHDAASILRRYLNRLPEPIIPLKSYYAFRDAIVGNDEETSIVTLRSLIQQLPDANRHLLLYILDMLTIFDACANENRMPASNLSAIFQPCILSHPAHDMSPNEYLLSQQVVVFFIEHNDWFLRDIRESLGSTEHLPSSKPKDKAHNNNNIKSVAKRDDNTKFTRPVVPRKAILSDTELPDVDVRMIAAYGGNMVSKPARPLTRSSSLRIPSRTSIPSQSSPNPNRSGLEFREQSLSRRERFKRQFKRKSVQIASLLPGGSADENEAPTARVSSSSSSSSSSSKDHAVKSQIVDSSPATPTDQKQDSWIVCAPANASFSIDSLIEAQQPKLTDTDKNHPNESLPVVQNVPRKPVAETNIGDYSNVAPQDGDEDDADDEEADEGESVGDCDIYNPGPASEWSGSMNLDTNKDNHHQTDLASPSSMSSSELVGDKSTTSSSLNKKQQQLQQPNDDNKLAGAAMAEVMHDIPTGSMSSSSSSVAFMDHVRGTLSDESGGKNNAAGTHGSNNKNRKSKWMTSYRQSVISLSQTPTVWGIFPQKTMDDMEQESSQKGLPSEATCSGE